MHLNDGNDDLIWKCVENYEQTNQIRIQATKEDIAHNRNIAIIRLKDHFWSIRCWPPYIVEILLSKDFKRQERLVLATFFHGNGLERFDIVLKIYKFYNRHWNASKEWRKRFYEFGDLFGYLDKVYDLNDSESYRIKSTYYYYSMVSKHMMFYDGSLRAKNGTKIPFIRGRY